MNSPDGRLIVAILILWFAGLGTNCSPAAEPAPKIVGFASGDGRITVAIDGLPVAMYSYQDETIPRPYFAHVRALNGVQATRNHPPIEGVDLVDHGTFHPGIWLAFGDMSGADNWRNKARVRHAGFEQAPRGGAGEGGFTVRNEYLDQKDPPHVVCQEVAQYTFHVHPAGYILLWDSTFQSDHEFAFGDQTEMGLGFRVATPLRVGKAGDAKSMPATGQILNSEGGKNERGVWGNSAAWCDYTGHIAGQSVGMTIFCHPDNFQPSRFHARDYGLLTANPFGRQSFDKGETNSVVVRPGETLRLRYGILVHSGPQGSEVDLAQAYQDYVRLTKN